MARQTLTGDIVRLLPDKGFGFVRAEDGVEYFFHRSGVLRTSTAFADLSIGMRVEFEAEQGDKGPRAIEVRTR